MTEQEKIMTHRHIWAAVIAVLVGVVAAWLDSFADANSPIDNLMSPILLIAVLALVALIAHNRWYWSATVRWHRELGSDQGWLNGRDYSKDAGPSAMRQHGKFLRSSLRIGLRTPMRELAWSPGKLVSGPRRLRGRSVYTPWARGVLLVGPQGSGKSQLLVHPIIDSPGALYVSTTKLELAALTSKIRAENGSHTHLFNPQGLGGVKSTFHWSPLSGCQDPEIAEARAAALVRGAGGASGTERAEFWEGKAVEIIRVYLHAAALAGYGWEAVEHWTDNNSVQSQPDTTAGLILQQHNAPPSWYGTYMTHVHATPNTKTGYFATVSSAVHFANTAAIREAITPNGRPFDVEQFIRQGETVYVVGNADTKGIAPLLTALTEEVFRVGQRLAAASEVTDPVTGKVSGGRLDPPLEFILDEVANSTPVPLDRWAADSRGWGIGPIAVVQDLSQLTTCWGPTKAQTIWTNLPTQIILPGVSNTADLEAFSALGGEREVKRISEGESTSGRGKMRSRNRNTSTHFERVVRGHVIQSMPKFHAYVLGLGRHPAMVKFTPGHKRSTKELRRLARKAKKNTTTTTTTSTDNSVVDDSWTEGAA